MSLSTDSLKGKVCVVTGAAKSIGLAIAVKYAEQGAKVALIDIDPLVEKSVEELVAKGYEAIKTSARVAALKKVDFPTDGFPTSPSNI